MKKTLALILLSALLLCGCARGGSAAESWTVPTIEPAPTAAATAAPAYADNIRQPESYIWNEAAVVNMSDPGVTVAVAPAELDHRGSLALFGGDLLPATVFGESYVSYSKLYLRQTKHDVLLDGTGALADNAYVEYLYVPGDWNEKNGLTVMAELCSYDEVMGLSVSRLYPHISYSEGALPQTSAYYLEDFVLAKLGSARYAQWLVLPGAYYSYAERQRAAAADSGTEPVIPRQVLLTFTCGSDLSDEEFLAAVKAVSQYAISTRTLPRETPSTPAPGEKGAA